MRAIPPRPEHPLRVLRQRLGLSLDELGRRAEVERSKLSRAERFYVRLSDNEVSRIAKVLGAPVGTLQVPTLNAKRNP